MAIYIPGSVIVGTVPSGGGGGEPVRVITNVQNEADIPLAASGYYFVSDSDKGGSQLYLLTGGVRYWLAMVLDS